MTTILDIKDLVPISDAFYPWDSLFYGTSGLLRNKINKNCNRMNHYFDTVHYLHDNTLRMEQETFDDHKFQEFWDILNKLEYNLMLADQHNRTIQLMNNITTLVRVRLTDFDADYSVRCPRPSILDFQEFK